MFPNAIVIPGTELEIHWYGIWIAVGILACFAVLFLFTKKKGLDNRLVDFVFYAGVLSIVLGFVAAAAFQGLYNYIENPEKGFSMTGGITFIGGLIGGIITFLLAFFLIGKKYGKLGEITRIAPCCILIAHAFGRIGCFFAGCCYGKVTDSMWGMKFPSLPSPVYPTMLYEAIFLFLLFGVCAFLYLKKDGKHNLAIYLIAYGVFRFLVEFIRGDHRGDFVTGISPSQFWSILMVVAGLVLLFWDYIFPVLKKGWVYLGTKLKRKEKSE